jgi:hypothetical protein
MHGHMNIKLAQDDLWYCICLGPRAFVIKLNALLSLNNKHYTISFDNNWLPNQLVF